MAGVSRSVALGAGAVVVAGGLCWLLWPGGARPSGQQLEPRDTHSAPVAQAPQAPVDVPKAVPLVAPEAGRSEVKPGDMVSVHGLSKEDKETMGYFNNVLKMGGKPTIPENATISKDDLPKFLKSVRMTLNKTDVVDMAWREEVSKKSLEATKEIDADIRDGKTPQYQKLSRKEGVPKHDQYDAVTIHIPAGTTDRYVIRLPATLFPTEVENVRQANAGMLALFDETLRLMFSEPNH